MLVYNSKQISSISHKKRGLTSIAWTHEPMSYVVSDGELLYKWDLDELPNARVFEIPDEDVGREKASVFKKIAGWFGVGR
jgi:hypothetical protein